MNSITYNVIGAGLGESYLRSGTYAGALRYTGALNVDYDSDTDVNTVTTWGNSVVTLYFGDISNNFIEAARAMSTLLGFFALVLYMKSLDTGEQIYMGMIVVCVVIALLMAVAAMIKEWGF